MENPEIPQSRCPLCKHTLDAVECASGRSRPSPGLPTICIYCGEVLVFDDSLSLRKPTVEDSADFAENPHWDLLRRAVDLVARFLAKGKSIN
jgi:hypothetical protein